MWLSLAKIELKKTFAFYFLLFLFFIFWNFFSLLSFFLFKNIEKFLEVYQEKIGISIFVSSEQGNKTVNSLVSEIKNMPFVKKVEVIPPQELFKKWKDELPSEIFSFFKEEEISQTFPYLIKIYLSSPEYFKFFQEHFMIISKVFENIIYGNLKLKNILDFAFFYKKIFWGLALTWFMFYFIFLILLNFFINSLLKKNIKIFILLGGSLIKINLIRLIIFILTMIIGFICSLLIYFYFIENLTLIFSFLKIYPNLNNIKHVVFFFVYSFLILIFLPALTIFLSLWINEF